MARYIGPKCRLCRRENSKLFLKGDKCYSSKCAMERRAYIPGQHGQRRRKVSDYGVHLREKQRIKRIYGLGEKQFHNFFELAERLEGATGENLLVLLERRLDNVVFRLGMAASRTEARQIVSHKQIHVNGRWVNVASYLIKPGDTISVSPAAKEHLRIKSAIGNASQKGVATWMSLDPVAMSGVFNAYPSRTDLPADYNENLIVELYSK